MDIVQQLAEQKIREAIEKGELDNLPGKGKALELEDLSRVPEELRSSYILLKNSGFLPEEISLKKEIVSLQTLINCCYENGEEIEEIKNLREKLNAKQLKFNMLMEKRKAAPPERYRKKIHARFGVR